MPNYLSPGVYVEQVPSGSRPIQGVSTAIAGFVGLAERGPFNKTTLITSWEQYRRVFGEFKENCYMPHSVYGYFNNGGSICYVVRVGSPGNLTTAEATLMGRGEAKPPTLKITAQRTGEEGNSIAVQIEDGSEGASDEVFRLIVRVSPPSNGSGRGGTGRFQEETFDSLTFKKGKNYVETVINQQSQWIKVSDLGVNVGLADRRPLPGVYQLQGGVLESTSALTVQDFTGDIVKRSGLAGFAPLTDITMVALPDLVPAYLRGELDEKTVIEVQKALVEHCEQMSDRVAILDTPSPSLTPQEVLDWRVGTLNLDSSFAALYYPWLMVYDPASGRNIAVPPSGHMAGIYARTDTQRGVHKAPANETVRGAIELSSDTTKGERDRLNPNGINCIVAFPGQGIRVWGARTLSSDPQWRYVPVRRLFNYLSKSIELGTQWVVFEPNDQDLWARISRTITAFLTREWRNGALFGATAEQAFYVKCDADLNTFETREAGEVITEIGIAPVKPAEFVIFRLGQKLMEEAEAATSDSAE